MGEDGNISDCGKAAEKARRERRLSTALRENLRRRKAQARARFAIQTATRSAESHDSAGIADDKHGLD
jgi:hypothetical protein